MTLLDEIDKTTVTQLRKKSGENWGAGVIIVNKQGQILIGVRTDTRTWGTPGGKTNTQETVLEGAIREVKEECNLDVKNLDCYDVHVGAYNNGGAGNEEKMWLSFMFITHSFSGEVKPQPSEMSGWVWMYPEEIKKLELFGPAKTGLESAGKKGLIKW
jgi:ADP-ribose pyrophosphatase/8-oxo-dGTP diphosphatase